MGYEESLRQAKELLMAEINGLKEQLSKKESSLRKLELFLKEPLKKGESSGTLTQNIVEIVYRLAKNQNQGVTAKAVVQEFYKLRNDVNESTIRSTLYQVSRKQKPTHILIEDTTLSIYVLKKGPTYDVEQVEDLCQTRRNLKLNG